MHLIHNDAAGGRGEMPVYDPFMGSGSTLIAGAALGRAGVGVDVEPMCVAVALERLGEELGGAPERIGLSER